MNRLLAISISANVVAVAWITWLLLLPHERIEPAAQVQVLRPPIQPEKSHESERPVWTRLEADDYRTYVTNLREAGCPEQTIRDIIKADIIRGYDEKRRVAESASDSITRMEQIERDESALMTALLGPAGPEDYRDAQELAHVQKAMVSQQSLAQIDTRAGESVSEQEPAAMPLAFVDPVPAHVLDDNQLGSLDSLKRKFIEDIGGTKQNPDDPNYRDAWDKAVPDAVERFRSWYGNEALNQFQIQAASKPSAK